MKYVDGGHSGTPDSFPTWESGQVWGPRGRGNGGPAQREAFKHTICANN